MLIRVAVITLAVVGMGSAARSQNAALPEPSAREIAAARDQADRIIARGEGASAYFENVTDGATATVRHKPSGMTCSFYGETPFDFVRLFPQQPGGPRVGDDAMCNVRTPDMDFSTYATRYPSRPSAEFVMADARNAIEQRLPDARPYEGALASAAIDDGAPPLIAAYRVSVEGKPKTTYVLVSHQGDWSFKGRATADAQDDMTSNLLVSLTFLQGLPGNKP